MYADVLSVWAEGKQSGGRLLGPGKSLMLQCILSAVRPVSSQNDMAAAVSIEICTSRWGEAE